MKKVINFSLITIIAFTIFTALSTAIIQKTSAYSGGGCDSIWHYVRSPEALQSYKFKSCISGSGTMLKPDAYIYRPFLFAEVCTLHISLRKWYYDAPAHSWWYNVVKKSNYVGCNTNTHIGINYTLPAGSRGPYSNHVEVHLSDFGGSVYNNGSADSPWEWTP